MHMHFNQVFCMNPQYEPMGYRIINVCALYMQVLTVCRIEAPHPHRFLQTVEGRSWVQ